MYHFDKHNTQYVCVCEMKSLINILMIDKWSYRENILIKIYDLCLLDFSSAGRKEASRVNYRQ